jgi:nickel superoxide dismutase
VRNTGPSIRFNCRKNNKKGFGMKMRLTTIAAVAWGTLLAAQNLLAHCQIPCGIYDDPARFTELKEHITTIEKSMNQILELGKETKNPNYNQLVRWVQNKDNHADEFSEIVTYYFLAQRIKPAPADDAKAYPKYVEQLTLLHQMVVAAMKAKQTTDLQHVETLRALVKKFEASYLGAKSP